MVKGGGPGKQQKQQQPAVKATKAAPPANASPSRKTDTIEWLAAQMRDGDVERVRSLFENMTPLAKPEVYQVGKPRTILRTVVQQGVNTSASAPMVGKPHMSSFARPWTQKKKPKVIFTITSARSCSRRSTAPLRLSPVTE